jgi:uncharacterized protein YbaR (Trm112 family)
MINQELLDILVCPKCRNKVQLRRIPIDLACANCRLIYEIKDDIPIMLIDEATPWDKELPRE